MATAPVLHIIRLLSGAELGPPNSQARPQAVPGLAGVFTEVMKVSEHVGGLEPT